MVCSIEFEQSTQCLLCRAVLTLVLRSTEFRRNTTSMRNEGDDENTRVFQAACLSFGGGGGGGPGFAKGSSIIVCKMTFGSEFWAPFTTTYSDYKDLALVYAPFNFVSAF